MTSTKIKKCKVAALIVAAGVGNRCNITIPKQYIKLAGKSVLFHTIKKFLANQYIDYIRVVIHKDHEDFYREAISSITEAKLLESVHGGKSRQASVKLGLESLQVIDHEFVIIHDACRPFVSNNLIDKLVEFAVNNKHTGVVPAMEVENTISLVNDCFIESTVPREKLRAIQTPQIFNFKELLSCHQSPKEFTDDSSLVIENKKHVAIIQGEKSNFKLTWGEDINMAKLLFEEPKFRVGNGYDIHRFIRPLAEPVCDEKFLGEAQASTTEYLDVFEERRQALTTKLPSEIELCKRSIETQDDTKCFIKICGVKIEHDMAIEAHSDGDVAIHAIVDAILGALGCGDIGEHFPPDSLKWKDCDSLNFLDFAAKKAMEKGYSISNLDVTIICEKPKISPYKAEMKKALSKILEIDDEFVNIKATTAEKLGSIGREEGIAANATVLLYKIFHL